MADIRITNPFKERVAIIGMIQEGKTNLLKWLLSITPVPFLVFDTLGQVSKGFNPVKPDVQTVVKPVWAQRQAVFKETCHDVWNKGNMVFAIDEVSEFCTKWELPDHLGVIVKMGGNRNIGLWVTTQRVAMVHNDILAGCKHHFIFRTYLPQDIEWYSKVVPKDVILMAKDLPPYHFIYYQLGHEPQVFKPVKKM
jgi:hypothetical protein